MFLFITFFFIFNIIYSSSSSSIYRPMSEREIDFGDNVCHYTHVHYSESNDTTQIIEYVKGCKKGEICREASDGIKEYEIKTCQKKDELELLTLGEKCEYYFQCDDNLKCKDGQCTINEGDQAYEKEGYYYCPSNLIPVYLI